MSIDFETYGQEDYFNYATSSHHKQSETEKTYLSAKKAYNNGEINTAQFNAVIDSIKYPGYNSRAAGYDDIVSGKNSMLGVMVDDAKNSPTVKDIASDTDMILGTDLSDRLDSDSSDDKPVGSIGYVGSGSSSAGSSAKGYNSYLDMLHAEQERIWNREDTSYQRTVRDLKAAGLNPVLAVNHGISASGGSGSSDSQVVGAVADLAAMAISGLSETAKGISTLAIKDKNNNGFSNIANFLKNHSGTIRNVVNTASTISKLLK